ncbi:MAG: hypothetical protein M3O46_02140, partial [Myxococcota bacterium]|nr:hypothetical protein [Myxococcota bacterium]
GEVAIGTETEGYDDDDPAALTDFHAALQPYGAWVEDSTYGSLWIPSATVVGADFHPYLTAGHWVYDDDWVWASEYEWGWAPFHYGRWVWVEGRGWAWIPGRVYRGAWVNWGIDDASTYVGWAPMPPAFVWFGGLPVAFPVYVGPRWVYCPRGEIFSPAVRSHVVVGAATTPIAARMRAYVPATPSVALHGPPPQRLGFQAAQIPHTLSDGNSGGITRAQQFARPSTAVALGAHVPTRIAPVAVQAPRAAAGQPSTRGPMVGPVQRGNVVEQGQRGPLLGQVPGATATGRVLRAPPSAGPATVIPAMPNAQRPPAPGAYRPPPSTNHTATPAPLRAAPMPRFSPSPSVRGGHR